MSKHVMSLLVVMHTEPIFLILYFREPQIMVCRNYTTFYLALLNLACILFKIGIYNAGMSTRERGPPPPPLPQFFSTNSWFCSFFATFFWRCTIISDLDFDFQRVLKLQPLNFHPRNQEALWKSCETIDNMKLDSSSDTDSSSKNTCISKVDVTFKDVAECLKMTIKHWKSSSILKEGR